MLAHKYQKFPPIQYCIELAAFPKPLLLYILLYYSTYIQITYVDSLTVLDDRIKDWFLMSSPLPTIIISLLYPFAVKVLGPWLMRNRKPFQLRKTIIIYNFMQVLFSTWIFWHGQENVWSRSFSLQCQPVDYSTSPVNMKVSRLS